MNIELTVFFNNADSGQRDEQTVQLKCHDETLEKLAHICFSEPTQRSLNEFFRRMYDNPTMDGLNTGVLYEELWSIASRWAFEKLGWYDVTIDVVSASVDGRPLDYCIESIDISQWSLQLAREAGFMYFYN